MTHPAYSQNILPGAPNALQSGHPQPAAVAHVPLSTGGTGRYAPVTFRQGDQAVSGRTGGIGSAAQRVPVYPSSAQPPHTHANPIQEWPTPTHGVYTDQPANPDMPRGPHQAQTGQQGVWNTWRLSQQNANYGGTFYEFGRSQQVNQGHPRHSSHYPQVPPGNNMMASPATTSNTYAQGMPSQGYFGGPSHPATGGAGSRSNPGFR